MIQLLCLCSEVFTLVYYAILYDNPRAQVFFMIEFFRLGIFFAMCNFYIKKASNLLRNKKVSKWILFVFYFIIAATFIGLGVY